MEAKNASMSTWRMERVGVMPSEQTNHSVNVMLRCSEASGSSARCARSFGVPQDDNWRGGLNQLAMAPTPTYIAPTSCTEGQLMAQAVVVTLEKDLPEAAADAKAGAGKGVARG